MSMIEMAPDAPDWDDVDAEQERARRHRRRQAAVYAYEEMIGEEKEIEDEFIPD